MSVLLNLGLNTLLIYVILMADRNNVTFRMFFDCLEKLFKHLNLVLNNTLGLRTDHFSFEFSQ